MILCFCLMSAEKILPPPNYRRFSKRSFNRATRLSVLSVVRMASGFLEFSREDSARLEEIRYELAKIGTNVNQIALAANRGRAPMVKAQWASVDELRRSLPMVAKMLSQIIAERRRQGVALFRKFVETQEGARHG